jgi:gliding motility-associated-like protein
MTNFLKMKLKLLTIFSVLLLAVSAVFANEKNSAPPIGIYMANTTMECGKSSPINVRVKDFKNVTNFQFSVNFPVTRMKGDSIVKMNPAFPDNAYNFLTLPNGDVTFSWTGAAVNLNDNDILFTIYLTPYYYGTNPPQPGTAAVKFSSSPTPIQSYTTASIVNTFPVTTADALVTILDKTSPVAICPNSQFYKGLDSVLVASITGFAIDDCGSAKITSYKMTGANNITGLGDANGKYYKLGVTKVVYTATDLAGNTAQCPFKIILVKPSDDTITVFANSKLSKCDVGGVVEYPVFIANANGKDLSKLNFSLEWNKASFNFVGITNVNPAINTAAFNTTMTANGSVGMTWSGADLNMTDNTRLFNLRLLPIGVASQSAVVVMSTPIPISVSSPTNPNYAVRTEAGELFIVDEIPPVMTCRADTIVYATTVTGSTPVPAPALAPKIVENCLLEVNNYKMTGATTGMGAYDPTKSLNLNPGVTNIAYNIKDYGGSVAACNYNVKVNRLKFALNKDSLPCSVATKTLDLRVSDFEKLNDFEFNLNWNPAMLGLATGSIVYPNATIKNNIAVTGNVAAGTLNFKWKLPTSSLTMNANDILMSFPFTLIGNVNSPVTIDYKRARLVNTTTDIVAQITNGSIKNYDVQKPTVTNCPTDIIDIVTVAGSCSKKITWTAPTMSDNCGAIVPANVKIYKTQSTTFPPNTPTFSGDDFQLGETTVTYSVTDLFNNTTTCSFKVKIAETVPPQIVSCVQNVSASTEPGKNGASVNWTDPAVNESCGIQSEVYSKAKGSYFVVGKQIVNYTVTDKSGNTASCSFTVTVTDNENPTFDPNFPANITVNTKIDTCGAFVTWTLPTAKDNHTAAGQIKITSNFPSGGFFPSGKTTVIYTAVDSSGNAVIRNFEITVIDNQAPKFVTCPPTVNVNIAGAACNSPYTPPVLKTKDNCAGIIDVFPSNAPVGNIFPIGTTKLLYIDPNNSSVKCNVDIVLKVSDKPTFSNVNDITVSTEPNDCSGLVPSVIEPTAQDACGTNNVTITKTPNLTKYPVGTTLVTYTAKDTYGNTTTATINVVVKDLNPPTMSACPADITALADPGKDSKIVSWIPPTGKAFCSNTLTITPTKQPNTAFVIGKTVVVYTATDASGNTLTCSFSVTVFDKQSPTIDCPPTKEIVVNADSTLCGKTVPLPIIKDNSGKTPTITSSTGIAPNDFYPVGKTLVTFVVSDDAGNTASCSYTVNVKDVTKPTFSGVKDLTVSTDATGCTAKINPSDLPQVSDGCGNTNITVKGNIDIDKLPTGVSNVILTATDPDGNVTTTTIKVTVVDAIAPVFAGCPSKKVLATDPGKDKAVATWTPPTATDNCSVTVKSTNNSGDAFPIGTSTVVYTATDASGNTATCTFEVVVADQEKPLIDCKDITVNNKAGECGGTLVTLPIVTDNVKVTSTTFTPTLPANNYFNVGTQTFAMSVSDAAGNIANCNLVVVIKDNETPKAATCPKDITVSALPGACETSVPSLAKPVFTDNCNINDVVITSNRDSLAKPLEFTAGKTTKVIYYAKDKGGNIGICTYNVTVIGNTKPALTCPANIDVKLSVTKCDTTINWLPANAVVGCSPLVGTPKPDINPGTIFKAGKTPVTYTIKDQDGNIGTCTFEVFVKETLFPSFTNNFPKDVELAANDTDCSSTYTWIVPTASDNCSKATDLKVEQVTGPKPADKLNVGQHIVTYRVTDQSGNTKEQSFTITVNDKTAPAFALCPKDISVDMFGKVISDPDKFIATISKSADCKEVALTFNPMTATDKCSSPVNITDSGATSFPIGVPAKYKYTATDAAGNTKVCEFNVTVEQFTAPKVAITTNGTKNPNGVCPGSDFELNADLVPGATYAWTGPNGFTSTNQNLSLKNIEAKSAGDYLLRVTLNNCQSTNSLPLKVNVMTMPQAKEDNYTVFAGDLLEDAVFPNDVLIPTEPTLVKVVENVANGKLNLRNDGKFEYTSSSKFFGEDKFKYDVCYETCPTSCSGATLARIQVKVKEVKIPNVITPNGDGLNDVMIIDYPFNSTDRAELYIYNEWGHLIYDAKPYLNAKAWDGTYKGNPVPDGTYYYVFTINDAVHKGFVTVIK